MDNPNGDLMSLHEISQRLECSYAWAVELKNRHWQEYVVRGARNKVFVPREVVEAFAENRPGPGLPAGSNLANAETQARRETMKALGDRGYTASRAAKELGIPYWQAYRDFKYWQEQE